MDIKNVIIAMKLSETQRLIMDYVYGYRDAMGFPPTQSEISEKFGMSKQAVFEHLKHLEKKEWIKKDDTGKLIVLREIDTEEKWLSKILVQLKRMRKENVIKTDEEYEKLRKNAIDRYLSEELTPQ